MMGVCLCTFCLHLDDVIIPWELTKRADLVAQKCYWILGYNRVFTRFD